MKNPLQESITIAQTQAEWDIPKDLEKLFCDEFIKEQLSDFNRLDGEKFYVMDYRKKRFIVDAPTSPFLCGHSMKMLEENQKDFGFLDCILDTNDRGWLSAVNEAAYTIFFDILPENRKQLVISFELAFLTSKNKQLILHHKVMPYKLCRNGNLWLSLCSVAESIQEKSQRATIINTKTGDYYKFDGTDFVISSHNMTEENIKLLRCLAKGLTAYNTCNALGVTESVMKRKKRLLYQEIGVHNAPEAVRWAHLEGIL